MSRAIEIAQIPGVVDSYRLADQKPVVRQAQHSGAIEVFQKRQKVQETLALRGAHLARWGLSDIAQDPSIHTLAGANRYQYTPFSSTIHEFPRISYKTEDNLFATIADGLDAQRMLSSKASETVDPEIPARIAGGKEAHLQISFSFTELSWRIAHRIWRQFAGNPRVAIEDLRQAAQLGLMQAIHNYAEKPQTERRSFLGYATKYIERYARQQSNEDFLFKNIKDDGSETYWLLQNFLGVRKKLREEKQGSDPHPSEIAQAMDISTEHAIVLQHLADPVILVDPQMEVHDVEKSHFVSSELKIFGREDIRKVIMLERALEFLKPEHASVLRLLYGMEDGHSLTRLEVAAEMEMNAYHISTVTHQSYERLREIISDMQDGTIDYDELRKVRDIRNVFGLLHCIDYQPSEDEPLQDLRLLMQEKLNGIGISERDKEIIGSLYGLNQDGQRLSSREASAIFGMSPSGIRAVDNRVRAKLMQQREQNDMSQASNDTEREEVELLPEEMDAIISRRRRVNRHSRQLTLVAPPADNAPMFTTGGDIFSANEPAVVDSTGNQATVEISEMPLAIEVQVETPTAKYNRLIAAITTADQQIDEQTAALEQMSYRDDPDGVSSARTKRRELITVKKALLIEYLQIAKQLGTDITHVAWTRTISPEKNEECITMWPISETGNGRKELRVQTRIRRIQSEKLQQNGSRSFEQEIDLTLASLLAEKPAEEVKVEIESKGVWWSPDLEDFAQLALKDQLARAGIASAKARDGEIERTIATKMKRIAIATALGSSSQERESAGAQVVVIAPLDEQNQLLIEDPEITQYKIFVNFTFKGNPFFFDAKRNEVAGDLLTGSAPSLDELSAVDEQVRRLESENLWYESPAYEYMRRIQEIRRTEYMISRVLAQRELYAEDELDQLVEDLHIRNLQFQRRYFSLAYHLMDTQNEYDLSGLLSLSEERGIVTLEMYDLEDRNILGLLRGKATESKLATASRPFRTTINPHMLRRLQTNNDHPEVSEIASDLSEWLEYFGSEN